MDQIKIGKFIALKRREKNITQNELAEELGITNRAISKWENGVCLPDSGTMPELCKILEISINDLFSGEVVDMNKNEKRLEEILLEMKRQKEDADKRLLALEIVIGFLSAIILLVNVFLAEFLHMEDSQRIALIIGGFIPFLIGMYFGLKIEQTAGYYECRKCKHKYIPTFPSVLWAMHLGRTRYMRCPKCNEKSWNKKVLTKEDENN